MILRRLLSVTLAGAVFAGCAAPSPETPAPDTPAAEAPAAEAPAAAPGGGTTDPAVTLPWPGVDVPALQERVDDGTQPWLLDPAEVARAYAAAAYGWDSAQVVTAADGSSADITGPQDERRTVYLTRQGPESVWLVTDDAPTP